MLFTLSLNSAAQVSLELILWEYRAVTTSSGWKHQQQLDEINLSSFVCLFVSFFLSFEKRREWEAKVSSLMTLAKVTDTLWTSVSGIVKWQFLSHVFIGALNWIYVQAQCLVQFLGVSCLPLTNPFSSVPSICVPVCSASMPLSSRSSLWALGGFTSSNPHLCARDPTKGLRCWASVLPLNCVPSHLTTFKPWNGQGDCAAIHPKFPLVYEVISQTFFLKGQEIFVGCLFLCTPKPRAGVHSKDVQRTLLSWCSQYSDFTGAE